MEEKICKQCQKKFEARSKSQKFCSAECRKKARKVMMKEYNKEYYSRNPTYHIKRVQKYYQNLSPEEKQKKNDLRRISGYNKRQYLKLKAKKGIADCGSELDHERKRQAKLGKKGNLSNGWHGGPVTLVCQQCKQMFEAPKCRTEIAKFCSKKCYWKWMVGTNSVFWQNGISFEPYSSDWNKSFKKIIRERDNYICFICKQYGSNVHHIDYDKKNSNSNNLITLCKICHAKTNHNRKYWVQYFQNKLNLLTSCLS